MTKKYRTEKKLIMDTGSPITILPLDKEIIKNKKMIKITRKKSHAIKKDVEFIKNIMVEAENRGIGNNLTMLKTKEADIKSQLGI